MSDHTNGHSAAAPAFDSLDARAVMGCLLFYGDKAVAEVDSPLSESLFFDPLTKWTYRAFEALRANGDPADAITVTGWLRDRKKLELVGGAAEISVLCGGGAANPSTIRTHLDKLRDQEAQRQCMEAVRHLSEVSKAGCFDRADVVGRLRSLVEKLECGPTGSKWEDIFSRGTLTGKQLRELEIVPRLPLVSDWLRESDLGFLFAARGVGKTWLALILAIAVAEGSAAGPWKAAGAYPVLYVDGEMPLELIQTRNRLLAQAGGNLHYLNHEQLFEQTGKVLNLTDGECQRAITTLCLSWKIKMLLLDNLSCLFRGVNENDADAWELILPWLMDLRRRKIAVVFVVHAGRNGQMRGTSRREDPAAWVIRLDDAGEAATARTGAKFVSSFTKPSRNTPNNPPPLEWSISTNAGNGTATVCYKQAEGTEAVLGWIRNGLSTCSEIAHEMNVTPGTVSKMATKLIEAGKLKKSGRGYALADENDNGEETQE